MLLSKNVFTSHPFIRTKVTLKDDVTFDEITYPELNFCLEKWHKGEFDIRRNDVKQGITVAYIILTFCI